MMNAFAESIPEMGMGWIFGIAILVILGVIYVRIRKNSRN
jgi:hypothetical protein